MGGCCCCSEKDVASEKKYQTTTSPSSQYVRDPTKTKPLPTIPKNLKRPTHVALYDYVARGDDELTFRSGDEFTVTDQTGEWWMLTCVRSNETGYGPSNFIAPVDTYEGESWFAGQMGRGEANRIILHRSNEKGAFLIRESQKCPGDFTLCVLDHNSVEGRNVKSYLIRRTEIGGKYYIYDGDDFRSLKDLVRHYSRTPGEICCQLTKPCVSVAPPPLPSIARNAFEVSRDSVTLIEKIGKGSFGEVWRGKWNNNVEVAVKKLTPGTMAPAAFIEEANIMRSMRHRNLLQLQAVVSSEPILIVTEYMHLGNLLHYLRKGDGRRSTTVEHYDMAAQVAAGLAFIENINFIHRDIRASNILVGENGVYKVSDFGLARILEDDIYNAAIDTQFPVKWTAPEGLTHNVFSIKSDVWSYGVLLSEIVTKGGVPYPGMTNKEIEPALRRGYRMPKPSNCDEQMYLKMLECWKVNPDERPTFKSLKEYFEDKNEAYVCINI